MKRTIRVYKKGAPPEFKRGDNGGFVHRTYKRGRNEPCYCGSGVKLKKCCGDLVNASHKYRSLKGKKDGYCGFKDCTKLGANHHDKADGIYYCEVHRDRHARRKEGGINL